MMRPMIGALINSAGILLGGVFARVLKNPVSATNQSRAKILLGVFTVWFGLTLTLSSLNGSALQRCKQLAIVLLAMALGKLAGKLMRLQRLSNAVGQFATRKMAAAADGKPEFNDGFRVATALFCAAPMAILGSVAAGLNGGFSKVFCVKAAMDGLATMAFSRTFGWGVMLSAIPVLAWQWAIIRGAALLEPALRHHAEPLLESINATDGLLIFCVALIILQIKKVAVAEYLPSLALAPLLTRWLW
jgi:uncharacterized membrane protein YqgA involved in biofilm formation